MKQIFVQKNKNTGKIDGWCIGVVFANDKESDTIIMEVTDTEAEEIKKGILEFNVIGGVVLLRENKTQKDRELIRSNMIIARNVLRQKFIDGTQTNTDINEALKLIL